MSKVAKLPNPNIITLKYPKEVDGQTYSELEFKRRPTAADSRDASRAGKDVAGTEIHLFANLCEVPPEVIAALDMYDYSRMQDGYLGFLAG